MPCLSDAQFQRRRVDAERRRTFSDQFAISLNHHALPRYYAHDPGAIFAHFRKAQVRPIVDLWRIDEDFEYVHISNEDHVQESIVQGGIRSDAHSTAKILAVADDDRIHPSL